LTVVTPMSSVIAPARNSEQADAENKQSVDGPEARTLVRCSLHEIRRVAARLAQHHIAAAHVIAWPLWRRAHQAAAQSCHTKRYQKSYRRLKLQL
jgi:hypothetical protein